MGEVSEWGQRPIVGESMRGNAGVSVPPFLEQKTCRRCFGLGNFSMKATKKDDPPTFLICDQCNGHGYVYRLRMVRVA